MEKDITIHILIVDDQQEIHDTFDRIFASDESCDAELQDFEDRFFGGQSPEDVAKPANQDAVRRYVLTHARSGEEAVERLNGSEMPFSVAFVDMRMPSGMDGVDTAKALWEIDPDLQVVISTAYSDHSWSEVLDRLGQSDRLLLLKKPFETDEARQLAFALSEKSRLSKAQVKEVAELGLEVERRRSAEERMQEMALRDALTNLPNRQYLIEKLGKIIGERTEQSPDSAVLFLDLDNFKIINDSLGHDAGDELLNQVAGRLNECVRDRDMATRLTSEDEETVRLGGDEFVVLLESLEDRRVAIDVAQRIVKRISEPFEVCQRLVNVGTSVGIAFIDAGTTDAQEALRNADTAMYRAKNSGKGRVSIFDTSMHDAVVRRMERQNQLREALASHQFQLHYQPIINLRTANVQGVEALLRWKDSDGQYVSPGEFVPIIEEIGLIQQVGEWVLEQAMLDYTFVESKLNESKRSDFYIGLNASPRQLADPFFVSRLDTIVKRHEFDRTRLKLEITEGHDVRHGDSVRQTLSELHESGMGIQIDDFGKGQSSLTCFQNYPIEAVKIDRSFTASIAKDHSHAVITEAIVGLAHHLNARVVAEGVESLDQLQSLVSWGCDAAQGYLFAPPMSANSLVKFLLNPTASQGIEQLRQMHKKASPRIPALPIESMTAPVGSPVL